MSDCLLIQIANFLLKKKWKNHEKGQQAGEAGCQTNRNLYFLTVCLCENDEKKTLLQLHVGSMSVQRGEPHFLQ